MADDKSKKNKKPLDINLDTTYVSIDSNVWQGNYDLSLRQLLDLLNKHNSIGNVVNVKPDVSKLPENLELRQTYIAVSENYLYIWVNNKWKKIPLIE